MQKSSFSKANRIRKKKDFEVFRQEGRKLIARHWILFYRENGLGIPRLAITVSGRYGNAVKRNRFRRWLRERFRTNKEKFKSMDIHFVAKAGSLYGVKTKAHQLNYKKELNEDFERLIYKFS